VFFSPAFFSNEDRTRKQNSSLIFIYHALKKTQNLQMTMMMTVVLTLETKILECREEKKKKYVNI